MVGSRKLYLATQEQLDFPCEMFSVVLVRAMKAPERRSHCLDKLAWILRMTCLGIRNWYKLVKPVSIAVSAYQGRPNLFCSRHFYCNIELDIT